MHGDQGEIGPYPRMSRLSWEGKMQSFHFVVRLSNYHRKKKEKGARET